MLLLLGICQRAAFQLLNSSVDVKVALFDVFNCAFLRLDNFRSSFILTAKAIGICNGKETKFVFVAQAKQIGSFFEGPIFIV